MELPTLPSELEHVWQWYVDLSAARSAGFADLNPIPWSDFAAYFQLIGVRPNQWEIEAIRQLDIAFLNSRTNPAKVADSAATFSSRLNKDG